MQNKMHWRYFALLLIPSLVILLLGVWLTFYSHSQSLQTMQEVVEQSNLRAVESLADNIDSLIRQAELSGMNLANQAARISTVDSEHFAQYVTSIDHLLLTQLNIESFLNAAVDRCYLFLFDENRVISQTNNLGSAEELYQRYFRVENSDYESFRAKYTARYYGGELLANVPVGYLDSTYYHWLLVQSVPLDPTQTASGVLIFTLDKASFLQRLSDNLADENALCMLVNKDGGKLVSQGQSNHWDDELIAQLLQAIPEGRQGVHYLSLGDQAEYLITVVDCQVGRVIAAQPVNTVFLHINSYHISIMVLILGMILLAVTVAMAFTRRNANAMKRLISSVSPEHQSGSATNVFAYMEEAILSARQKEELLAAQANAQHTALRSIFIKRLLRGEWQTESALQHEQELVGLSMDAKAYVVLLIRLWELPKAEEPFQRMEATIRQEFGTEYAYLVRMSEETIACLLLTKDAELKESIEAVAESLSQTQRATVLVSSTVTTLLDIPRAYRQVRVMSRMVEEDEGPLQWYSELFQDDVLYNFETSVYMETGLRNNIVAGNEQGTRDILKDLYERTLKTSVYSDHVLRFFAYDLYRLVNHLGTAGNVQERRVNLDQLRQMLDSVMEDTKRFDAFFNEVNHYCLSLCHHNQQRRGSNSDELLQRIIRYIDEHYTDPDMSVTSIADALGVTGKYVSLFFKEQSGGKISAYIENKRIAYACQLLDTTEMTITDIAAASGYALTHTFRVAFKKVQGVTPLEWKKSRQQ